MSRVSYKNICCGCGPANMGLLINAHIKNRVETLLHGGIAFIEKTELLGSGSIIDYRIFANSLGSVFMECLEKMEFKRKLSVTNEFKNIEQSKDIAPYLEDVGKFENKLCDFLMSTLKDKEEVGLFQKHEVVSLHQQEQGLYKVKIKDLNTNTDTFILGQNVFLNIGGTQNEKVTLESRIISDINLIPYREKVILSDKIMRANRKDMRAMFEASLNILILGSSHSSLSVALKLQKEQDLLSTHSSVKIFHRSPVKLYFKTDEEAKKVGYMYDKAHDVCPLSGRINRFGGLRYNASNFAQELMGLKPKQPTSDRFSLVSISPSVPDRESILQKALNAADLIVACFGYEAKTVPIYDSSDKEIKLLRNKDGGLETDQCARLYTQDGDVLKNVYSYGLGSGLRASKDIGGEPSYAGRLDSVWLYQFDIGDIAFRLATE